MPIKYIVLLLLFPLAICANAENLIKGKINRSEGSIQLMKSSSPFDYNVRYVAESSIENGQFEFRFDLEEDTEITFEIDGLLFSADVFAGSSWDIHLEIKELSKPDFDGNMQEISLTHFSSDNLVEMQINEIKKEVQTIGEKYRKGNGRLSKGYTAAKQAYIKKVIAEPNSELHSKLANSMTIAFTFVRHKETEDGWLRTYFEENFEVGYSGIRVVNWVYADPIFIKSIKDKDAGADYFGYLKKATLDIEDLLIRETTHALLITNTIGRKWMDQPKAMAALKSIIGGCKNPKLKTYLESFYDFHSSSLIGSKLVDQDFMGLDLEETQFSDFRGQYLLLDFWATWCGPCVKSMKKLPEMKNKYEQLDVLCITDEKDEKKVRRFINNRGYSNNLKFGISNNYAAMESYFNLRAIPLYYLVDPEGVIIDKAVSDPIPMIEKHLGK